MTKDLWMIHLPFSNFFFTPLWFTWKNRKHFTGLHSYGLIPHENKRPLGKFLSTKINFSRAWLAPIRGVLRMFGGKFKIGSIRNLCFPCDTTKGPLIYFLVFLVSIFDKHMARRFLYFSYSSIFHIMCSKENLNQSLICPTRVLRTNVI